MRHGRCLRGIAPLARLLRHLERARGDEERLEKLEVLADAVYKRCKASWEREMQECPSHPKGYPGLRRTRKLKSRSAFSWTTRLPNGLVVVCKRWYQKEMAKYLLDNTVFHDTELSWTDVVQTAADFNTKRGFPTEERRDLQLLSMGTQEAATPLHSGHTRHGSRRGTTRLQSPENVGATFAARREGLE